MNNKTVTIWIFFIVIITMAFFYFWGNGYNSFGRYLGNLDSNSASDDYAIILSRDDAISDNWDDIKEYVSGSETTVACSSSSGNCYDLDTDISNGEIQQIYFPKGGYLYFSASFDEDGNASDIDKTGTSWDFTLDMGSSIVSDAISAWADDNGFVIE